jgi:hypothetical protein
MLLDIYFIFLTDNRQYFPDRQADRQTDRQTYKQASNNKQKRVDFLN